MSLEQTLQKEIEDSKVWYGREKKTIVWENDNRSKSIYFRDPSGNLVEFITRNYWGVND